MLDARKGENLLGKVIDYELWDNTFQYDLERNFVGFAPGGNGLCLDLGAGLCSFRRQVQDLGYTWIGLDTDKISNALTVQGDAYCLPFDDNIFDAVLVNHIVEHLSHPWKMFEEIHRILKPGGYVFGSVSFLEPFHKSYYHVSHWGLNQMLGDAKFSLLKIKPGASVFVMLFHYFIDYEAGTTVAPVIAKLVVPPFIFLIKIISMMYGLFKFRRITRGGFLKKKPLTMAAHLLFVARSR
jgi:SAM-dependent methyltransferase